MDNIVFFDSEEHKTLLPLTYTKPVAELRVGILKIKEKWEYAFHQQSSFYTQPHLADLFPLNLTDDNLFILGGLLPSDHLITAIEGLNKDSALIKSGRILAAKGSSLNAIKHPKEEINFEHNIQLIKRPWQIFELNGTQIEADLKSIDKTSFSSSLEHTQIIGDPAKIFIHESATVHAISLNTSSGSIYVGPNAEVMEGAVIRGPFALCDSSTVKMGAKIYGDSTIGPHCKVGGEIGNSVFQGFSNKGHDGYLGNSVIGEWCNLGADTNASNLKNNYSNVKLWDYVTQSAIDTELIFCGLIMGDHSKTGINTMLNTGTLIGVGSNIFGAHFPPTFIPSFSWGSGTDFMEHDFVKFCNTAEKVMARRGLPLSKENKSALQWVFQVSSKFRS